jgi:SagB-type dehydrogenase family enzyme
LLRLGAGVVRRRGDYDFRTYSSAGALYPIELYVATAHGLFHFHPRELALARLGDQDVRGALGGGEIVLALTGILARTAWKYGARGYRHLFWDAGTMLANLLELAPREARILTAFVDDDVNAVLGIDGVDEQPLALLQLETDGGLDNARLGIPDEVFRRRGSVRDFSPEPIARDELVAILAGAMGAIPLDVPPSNEFRLIANAVAGLEPGAYRFQPPDGFALLRAGDFRRQAGYLVLEQYLGALAAATMFAMADLDEVLRRHGDCGYRAAQLEAGIRVGRVYLGAFARGLGATASTFYDDDVTAFLAPEEGLSPMLCAAVGSRRFRGETPEVVG